MKTNVNETSIEAYHSLPIAGYLQPKEAQIMTAFANDSVTYSRKQLAQITGMELSSVCGRVNSLLTKNTLAVRGHRKDPVTGNTQEVVGLPIPDQGALFGKVA